MRSIKSTLGGACSVLGKTLMGGPMLCLMYGIPISKEMSYVWLSGFIIEAFGAFFAHLFSADKSDVRRMMMANEREADERFETKAEAEKDRTDTKTMLRGKQDVEEK